MKRSFEQRDRGNARLDGKPHSSMGLPPVQWWGLMVLAFSLNGASLLALVFGLLEIHLIHGTMDKFVFVIWICIFGSILVFGVFMLKWVYVRRR